MPHLSVHVLESDLAGREAALIGKLTDAIVDVYGEWARDLAVVHLIGLPPSRWGIGGAPAEAPAPSVTFGIREAAFGRPDADELVARLARMAPRPLRLVDIGAVFGARCGPGALGVAYQVSRP